ncbi:hypothetical protein GCM10022293_61840 [Azospirillum formosense]
MERRRPDVQRGSLGAPDERCLTVISLGMQIKPPLVRAKPMACPHKDGVLIHTLKHCHGALCDHFVNDTQIMDI